MNELVKRVIELESQYNGSMNNVPANKLSSLQAYANQVAPEKMVKSTRNAVRSKQYQRYFLMKLTQLVINGNNIENIQKQLNADDVINVHGERMMSKNDILAAMKYHHLV